MFVAIWTTWFVETFESSQEKKPTTCPKLQARESFVPQFPKWDELTVYFLTVLSPLLSCCLLSALVYLNAKCDGHHSEPLSHRMKRSAAYLTVWPHRQSAVQAKDSTQKLWPDLRPSETLLWVSCTCLLPWQCSPSLKYQLVSLVFYPPFSLLLSAFCRLAC